MKLLHILSERSWRGGEQQAAYLIDVCQRENIECHVACRKGSAFSHYCEENKITNINLPFRGQFDIYTASKIKQYCLNNQINFMHLHTGNAHGISVVSHLLGNVTPMILSRRVIFPVQNKIFSKLKYNFPAIQKILCASEAIKHVIKDSLDNPNKCVTIYDGIDINKFKPPKERYLHNKYHINKDTLVIGNVSALDINKGLFTFIDTAKIILEKNINAKFFIIGEGPLKFRLMNYIRKLGLDNYVILTGFLKNIADVIQGLDLFVLTTVAEGLGTSLLDAMACNIPVVATKTGGVPEVVINQLTGLLAPVNDAKGISEQIIKIISDDTLKQNLIVNAHEHLLRYFTKEEMGMATIDIYKNCQQQLQRDIKTTIIVTTYNRPDALNLVLNALDQQDDHNSFEVIVADDGSTEDTKNLINKLSKKVNYPLIYLWQEDNGFRAAKMRNKATAIARGKYIIFLDGDSIPDRTFVRRHQLLSKPDYFVVGNRVLLTESFTEKAINNDIDLTNYSLTKWRTLSRQKIYNRSLPLYTLPLGPLRRIAPQGWRGAKTCNIAIWKENLIGINGFDETYQGWGYEDSDLVIRLLRSSIKRKNGHFSVPVLHLWHPENDRSQETGNLMRLKSLLKSNVKIAKIGLDQYC